MSLQLYVADDVVSSQHDVESSVKIIADHDLRTDLTDLQELGCDRCTLPWRREFCQSNKVEFV